MIFWWVKPFGFKLDVVALLIIDPPSTSFTLGPKKKKRKTRPRQSVPNSLS